VHVGGEVGEEDIALATDPHQVDALSGDRLLQHLPDAAGGLVVEAHLALVGHHRPLPRHHVSSAEAHLEHLGVLQAETVGCGRLEVLLVEQRAAHVRALPQICRSLSWHVSGARVLVGLDTLDG
jgi:hypothetical protein